jgi:hypothetical protein
LTKRKQLAMLSPQTSAGLVEVTGNGGSPHGWDPRTWGLQQEYSVMSITIKLDLPDALLNEARASGLLESQRLGELLNEELRRERARKNLGRMLKELHSIPGDPLTDEEIQAEIDVVRAERRKRESGR